MRFVTRFKPVHLRYLRPREDVEFSDEVVEVLDDSLFAFTLHDARGPFASVGVQRWNARTGVAWLVADQRLVLHAAWACKVLRSNLPSLMKVHELRRVEAIVRNTARHVRFVERLGFIHEGVAYNYFPDDADGIRYVYLQE